MWKAVPAAMCIVFRKHAMILDISTADDSRAEFYISHRKTQNRRELISFIMGQYKGSVTSALTNIVFPPL